MTSNHNSTDNDKINRVLSKIGYINGSRIANTLQGSIWRAEAMDDKKSSIFKITDQYLHANKLSIFQNKLYRVNEDITKEQDILKYLTQSPQCPQSIVKFVRFFKSRSSYYLVMEDGGSGLIDFIRKSHELINSGRITIREWHRTVKVVFKQMIEAIEYIHSKNICHFDISLENFLVNDVKCELIPDQDDGAIPREMMKIRFLTEDIRVKLCDFGLAQRFKLTANECLSDKYCGKQRYKSPEINRKKKVFDAKKNDIWCLGVCLFAMMFNGFPWDKAENNDIGFVYVMNGYISHLLGRWNKVHFGNNELLDLLHGIFQFEPTRMSLDKIKESKWLKMTN